MRIKIGTREFLLDLFSEKPHLRKKIGEDSSFQILYRCNSNQYEHLSQACNFDLIVEHYNKILLSKIVQRY